MELLTIVHISFFFFIFFFFYNKPSFEYVMFHLLNFIWIKSYKRKEENVFNVLFPFEAFSLKTVWWNQCSKFYLKNLTDLPLQKHYLSIYLSISSQLSIYQSGSLYLYLSIHLSMLISITFCYYLPISNIP